jgi:hypothetical protein
MSWLWGASSEEGIVRLLRQRSCETHQNGIKRLADLARLPLKF